MKRLLPVILFWGLIFEGCAEVDQAAPARSTITVTPALISLSGDAQVSSASQSIAVECLKGSGNPDFATTWTLASNQTWLKLSPNPDGSDASASIESTATRTLYLVVEENTSLDSRTAELTLNAAAESSVSVSQNGYIPGTITLTPTSFAPFNGEAHTPASQNLTVTCSRYDGNPDGEAAWTLASNQSWLKFSLKSDGAEALASISQVGTQSVYLVLEANKTGILRTANITLNGSETPTLTLSQEYQVALPALPIPDANALDGVVGIGEMPNEGQAYLGAFWRAGQIGERVIRTQVGENAGDWSATVAWYDAAWNPASGDGVVLALGDSADPNIRHASNEPADAENFKVTGTAATISGTVGVDEYIVFRIGLTKSFMAYDAATQPARYAVVLLSYGASKKQKLFIRQGEGADYVMRPGDKDGSGTAVGGADDRRFACKVAPYNLTASDAEWAAKPGGTSVADHPQIAVRGGVFVKYPTQGGAFFQGQGSDEGAQRRAFTHLFYTKQIDFITSYRGPALWEPATDEGCPEGYRRMQDGDPAAQTASEGPIVGSEMRQSLWLEPVTGTNKAPTEFKNSAWGYYADGFFDRRALVDGATPKPGVSAAVAANTRNAAYRGRLYFNPTTHAALFYPAPGYRNAGDIEYAGDRSYYWMGSTYTSVKMACMFVSSGQASPYSQNRNMCFSIRCVRQE